MYFSSPPKPPYFACIFSSQRSAEDEEGYSQMAVWMETLASEQPGFLGVESVRGNDGYGMTVSYWKTREAMAHWKTHTEHIVAQMSGKACWYERFEIRVAEVVESVQFERGTSV